MDLRQLAGCLPRCSTGPRAPAPPRPRRHDDRSHRLDLLAPEQAHDGRRGAGIEILGDRRAGAARKYRESALISAAGAGTDPIGTERTEARPARNRKSCSPLPAAPRAGVSPRDRRSLLSSAPAAASLQRGIVGNIHADDNEINPQAR